MRVNVGKCQEYGYFKLFLTHVLTFVHFNIEQHCYKTFLPSFILSHDTSHAYVIHDLLHSS